MISGRCRLISSLSSSLDNSKQGRWLSLALRTGLSICVCDCIDMTREVGQCNEDAWRTIEAWRPHASLSSNWWTKPYPSTILQYFYLIDGKKGWGLFFCSLTNSHVRDYSQDQDRSLHGGTEVCVSTCILTVLRHPLSARHPSFRGKSCLADTLYQQLLPSQSQMHGLQSQMHGKSSHSSLWGVWGVAELSFWAQVCFRPWQICSLNPYSF